MDTTQTTIDYYDANAAKFLDSTANVEFGSLQQRFVAMLPKGGKVLDLGCGSGRDSLAFLRAGFKVDAMDGSAAMVKAAHDATGLPVTHALFSDYSPQRKYDGIWACSSLLHVPKKELPSLLAKYADALNPSGVFYLSFKLGSDEGIRNGRWFTDLSEDEMGQIVAETKNLVILETSITSDVRPGRQAEKWLNVWCGKNA